MTNPSPTLQSALDALHQAGGSPEVLQTVLQAATTLRWDDPEPTASPYRLLVSLLRAGLQTVPPQEALAKLAQVECQLDGLQHHGLALVRLCTAALNVTVGSASEAAAIGSDAITAYRPHATTEQQRCWLAELQMHTGVAFRRMDLRDEALGCYHEGLQTLDGIAHPEAPSTRSMLCNNMGVLLLHELRPSDAIPHLERAVEITQTLPGQLVVGPLCNLVDAYIALDALDDARRVLQRAEQHAQTAAHNATVLRKKARLQLQLRCPKQALEALEQADQRAPPRTPLQEQRALILRGRAWIALGESRGFDVLVAVHDTNEQLSELRNEAADHLSAGYAAQGAWEQAHRWAQVCIELQRERYQQTRLARLTQLELQEHQRVRRHEAELLQVRTVELEAKVHERTEALALQNEALQRARAQADAADRAKSAFLSVVSHELRTPLNAIQGYTELLREEHDDGMLDDPSLVQGLDRIQTASQRLLTLVQQVLHLTDPGPPALTDQPTAVGPIFDALTPLATNPTHTVRVEDPGALRVSIDARLLEDVLTALVDNAITHTVAGEVVVGAQSTDDGSVLLWVRDEGGGLPEQQVDQVLEVFGRLDMSYTRSTEGLGIGLAVAHKRITAAGGSLTLENRPGQGLTVWIRGPWLAP